MVKVAGHKADAFIRSLDPNILAVLFYGPDEGQVRQRAAQISKSICPDLDDPFRIADIPPSTLKDDPAKLSDECSALAFGGGRRVIKVSGITEIQSSSVVGFLKNPIGDSLLVITAGNLTPKSKLRSAFETSNVAAAIACYPLEGNQLLGVIRSTFENTKTRIDPDAIELLASLLADDSACLHSEIEKLSIYALSDDRSISVEDVRISCGDQSANSVFELAYAVADGSHKHVQSICDRLLVSGDNPIAILRGISRHFDRLIQARGDVEHGSTVDSALKMLRPPVFFKETAVFKRQVSTWNSKTLLMAITRLLEIERQCKTTGSPAAIFLQRGLLEIATLASRQKAAQRRP